MSLVSLKIHPDVNFMVAGGTVLIQPTTGLCAPHPEPDCLLTDPRLQPDSAFLRSLLNTDYHVRIPTAAFQQ